VGVRIGQQVGVIVLVVLLWGCPEPQEGELPPEGDGPSLLGDDDDDDATPADDGEINLEPEHVLTILEVGEWTLTPLGGPYTALTGQLSLMELHDGLLPGPILEDDDDEPIETKCELLFGLVGLPAPAEATCPTCDSTWVVDFFLDEGEPENCLGPYRPEDGDRRTFGFTSDDLALYWDFEDLGIWEYWYFAQQEGDVVSFEWTAEMGFNPVDMN
jgi:hypothetical protein